MRKVLTFVIVALLLVSCDKPPSPPAPSAVSGDAVQRKLQELAGSGATDCGRISQAQDKIQAAGACVMDAAKKKQAFYVIYELPGLMVALGGDATGKLYSVQQAQPAGASPGGAAELDGCAMSFPVAHCTERSCHLHSSRLNGWKRDGGGQPAWRNVDAAGGWRESARRDELVSGRHSQSARQQQRYSQCAL